MLLRKSAHDAEIASLKAATTVAIARLDEQLAAATKDMGFWRGRSLEQERTIAALHDKLAERATAPTEDFTAANMAALHAQVEAAGAYGQDDPPPVEGAIHVSDAADAIAWLTSESGIVHDPSEADYIDWLNPEEKPAEE